MPTMVHFDIASEDVARAKEFYESLFGWKMLGPPGMTDYFLVETSDLNGNQGVGGGLGRRSSPEQKITIYFGVDDIEHYSRMVESLGGKVIQEKLPVPGWGYLAVCQDTEGNMFGLWQDNE